MAFEANGGSAGSGEDTLSWLVQRIRSVQVTSGAVESASSQLGTAADTPALRAKLANLFTSGNNLIDQIEPRLLSYRSELQRAEQAKGANLPAAQNLRRMEDQYGELKGKLLAVCKASVARMREFKVRAPAVPEADARGGLKKGTVVVQNQLAQLKPLQTTDTDAAIAEVRVCVCVCWRSLTNARPMPLPSLPLALTLPPLACPALAGECAGGAGYCPRGCRAHHIHTGPALTGA